MRRAVGRSEAAPSNARRKYSPLRRLMFGQAIQAGVLLLGGDIGPVNQGQPQMQAVGGEAV